MNTLHKDEGAIWWGQVSDDSAKTLEISNLGMRTEKNVETMLSWTRYITTIGIMSTLFGCGKTG
jgi:hypothetical protein